MEVSLRNPKNGPKGHYFFPEMKTFNPETGETTWSFTSWWEKTIHVIGWISTILFIIGFLKGFIDAL